VVRLVCEKYKICFLSNNFTEIFIFLLASWSRWNGPIVWLIVTKERCLQ
jgi:hypothetical protein